MTINQLSSLDEQELQMSLYIVNVISPIKPSMEILPHELPWLKHDMLVKKLLDAFQQVKPEYHSIYISLMQKLGVKIEINPAAPSK